MQNVKTVFTVTQTRKITTPWIALILIVFIAMGSYVFNIYRAINSAALPKNAAVLSEQAFEEQYGLRVNLLAVTAAGGMVDLRLKIVDGEKAKLLLQDKNNFPALYVGDGKVVLNSSEEAKSQEIKFESGGNVFLMFPNTGNAVKPGTSVTLGFGEAALEPIEAK